MSLSPLGEGLTIAAVRDMTEHLAYENRLIESTRRRLLAEDHERIARELHDTVIQELFALGMTLQSTIGRIGDPEVADRISASVRHPRRRDPLDPGPHLRGQPPAPPPMAKACAPRWSTSRPASPPSLGFEPSVSFHGPVETAIPARVHDHVRAVVREGLANVARHADATAATVSVTVADDQVTVRVNDDGVGVPTTLERRSGLGNLADRALELGGRCEWSGLPRRRHGAQLERATARRVAMTFAPGPTTPTGTTLVTARTPGRAIEGTQR